MTNRIQDFSNSLDEINDKENWAKVDQELKKKIKHQIKKILLINPHQLQTSFIDLDILKNNFDVQIKESDFFTPRIPFVPLNIDNLL